MNHSCGVAEQDLGPYLLGHLDPEREAAVAQLVAACPSCVDEVARLRDVVATMAAGSPPLDLGSTTSQPWQDAVRLTAPVDGLHNVLAAINVEVRDLEAPARTRRRRYVAILAAAAVLAAATIGVGSLLLPRPERSVVLAREGAVGEAAASAVLEARPWGTAIRLEASGLRAGQTYGVWLERREGGRLPAGSFSPDNDGTVTVALSSGLLLADSGAVGIALLPDGQVTEAVDVLTARLDQAG